MMLKIGMMYDMGGMNTYIYTFLYIVYISNPLYFTTWCFMLDIKILKFAFDY